MKKIVAILLSVVLVLSFCACSEKSHEEILKDGDAFAEKYLKHLLNMEFSQTDSLVVFNTEKVVKEASERHSSDIKFDGQKIQIDGMTFDSVKEFISEAEKQVSGITLVKIEKKDAKEVPVDQFKKQIEGNAFAEELIAEISDETLKTLYSVDFNVSITMDEETEEGVVSVLMVYENNQWKAISPTWFGWFVLGYGLFK